jgi:hypothetical protein
MTQPTQISVSYEAHIALTEAEGFIRGQIQTLPACHPIVSEANRVLSKIINAKKRLIPDSSESTTVPFEPIQLSLWERVTRSSEAKKNAATLLI